MLFRQGMRIMRATRGMSQAALANASGVNLWYVSRAEAGRLNLSDAEQSRIRIALTWSPELDPLLERIEQFHYEQ